MEKIMDVLLKNRYVKIYREKRNIICKMLKEVIYEAKKINIPISNYIFNDVCIDYFTDSRIGYCECLCNGAYIIHISYKLLDGDNQCIKNVLAHEILHTCILCKNHLVIWKYYANIMSHTYGYNIKETMSWEDLGVK